MGLITNLIIGGAIAKAADTIGQAISENSTNSKGKESRGKKITLPDDLSSYKGEKVHDVYEILVDEGFRNVVKIPVPIKHMTIEERVAEVTLNGSAAYRADDKVYTNDRIEILYYTIDKIDKNGRMLTLLPRATKGFSSFTVTQAKEFLIKNGFCNISLVPVYTDSVFTKKKIGKVKCVSIDGNDNIEGYTAVYVDDKVKVYYYTNMNERPEDIIIDHKDGISCQGQLQSNNMNSSQHSSGATNNVYIPPFASASTSTKSSYVTQNNLESNYIKCDKCGAHNKSDCLYCVKCGYQMKKRFSVRNRNCQCCGAPFTIDEKRRLYNCEYCGNTDIITNSDIVEFD